MPTVFDMQATEQIIAEVAAMEIMPRFRALSAGDIEMKGVDDPVTVADKAAEQALSQRLTSYLPGSVVVGEETFAADATIAARFASDDYVWVIDPIDGTRNFIAGVPEFGVMVALVRHKKILAAWIHDPNTGDTIQAEQGGGVWLCGHKMTLAGHNPAFATVCVIGSRLQKLLAKPEYATKMVGVLPHQVGSAAAFDYARLFTGAVHFAGHGASRASCLLYRQSKPWDHVPGLCLVAEAGGHAADLRGDVYDMQTGLTGLLVAPNREIWADIHAMYKPVIDGFLKN